MNSGKSDRQPLFRCSLQKQTTLRISCWVAWIGDDQSGLVGCCLLEPLVPWRLRAFPGSEGTLKSSRMLAPLPLRNSVYRACQATQSEHRRKQSRSRAPRITGLKSQLSSLCNILLPIEMRASAFSFEGMPQLSAAVCCSSAPSFQSPEHTTHHT